jgi:hypothetical protein
MSIDSSGNAPRNETGIASSFNDKQAPPSNGSADRSLERAKPPAAAAPFAGGATEDLLNKTKDTARATAKAFTSQASELAANIGNELSQTADEQKGRGADAMRGFAKAVHGAANDLDNQSPTVARYIRRAAASVEDLSETVRSRSVNDLVVAAKDTARTHPTAFFAGAVAAGFAISRFFKSSARTTVPGSPDLGREDGRARTRGPAGEAGDLGLGGRS